MPAPKPRNGCRWAEDAGWGRVRPCSLIPGHFGDHKPLWFEPARPAIEGDIVVKARDPGDRRHAEATRRRG